MNLRRRLTTKRYQKRRLPMLKMVLATALVMGSISIAAAHGPGGHGGPGAYGGPSGHFGGPGGHFGGPAHFGGGLRFVDGGHFGGGRRFWGGRWWGYGVGPCWAIAPDGSYYWICD
jgi:hypothetical protein